METPKRVVFVVKRYAVRNAKIKPYARGREFYPHALSRLTVSLDDGASTPLSISKLKIYYIS